MKAIPRACIGSHSPSRFLRPQRPQPAHRWHPRIPSQRCPIRSGTSPRTMGWESLRIIPMQTCHDFGTLPAGQSGQRTVHEVLPTSSSLSGESRLLFSWASSFQLKRRLLLVHWVQLASPPRITAPRCASGPSGPPQISHTNSHRMYSLLCSHSLRM